MRKIRSYLHSNNNPLKVTGHHADGGETDLSENYNNIDRIPGARVTASLELWRDDAGFTEFRMANIVGNSEGIRDLKDLLEVADEDLRNESGPRAIGGGAGHWGA